MSEPTRSAASPPQDAVPKCPFCRIASGEIPAQVVYQDDQVVAFRDIHPQAPTHILVIPRHHVSGINEPNALDPQLLAALFSAANRVAREEGLADGGYRLVLNVGPDAGQSVFHLHLHLLGGRPLGWPPG